MKKEIFIFILVTLAAASVAQPSVTLLTFGGYTFADKFEIDYENGYGNGKIEDGFQWGVGLEISPQETMGIELYYQTIKTDASYTNYVTSGSGQTRKGVVAINYIMIGGTRYAPLNDRVAGFGSFDIGAAWSSPSESLESESVTKFAWGGRLGVRIQTSEKVSLRLHAQLLSPVQWAGGGFYFGTGGSGAGVTTGSTIYQFNLGGSLNYRLR